MKPATRRVLDLLRLRGGDGLTDPEATEALACRRLAARIHELRKDGYRIDDVRERSPMGATYARYFLAAPTIPAPMTGAQETWL